MKNDTYFFHQTPSDLARDIVAKYDYLFEDGDVLYEPFRGEGAFYNALPERCSRIWAEIEEDKDYKDETEYDWVITNPPFRLEGQDGRRNAFWELTDYFTQHARRGIVFLCNDRCISTLTPRRQAILRERGWGITHLTICNVKKWRGRYWVIVFEKTDTHIVDYLTKTY